jgi:hypothetical protein
VELGDVTVDTFAGRGEKFGIRVSEDWGPTPARTPCSIVLHGPLDHALPQQIWPLDHDELGRLDIFLVPLGPDGDAMRYEAVFN